MMQDSRNAGAEPAVELLDVSGVAVLCVCSARTVRRLADAGRMPKPVRFGGLVRWRRSEVMRWIEGGCQPPAVPKATAR